MTTAAMSVKDLVLEGELVHPAGAEQVAPEGFTGIVGRVRNFVVHGDIHVHHEYHEAGGGRHDRHESGDGGRDAFRLGDGRDDRDAPGDTAAPRRRGLLVVALGNAQMFRRFMLLLAFAAVVLLGIAGMVIVAYSELDTSFVLLPMVITVAAVVLLTWQAHGLRSGLKDLLRDKQPAEERFRDDG